MSFLKELIVDKVFSKFLSARNKSKVPKNPKVNNLKTGHLGETIAKRYLQRKGFKIIEENYRTKFAEIDLIAQLRNTLVFIEVRTKIGKQFGMPEESLNKKKINKVVKDAQMYIKYKNYTGKYRIDAICIVLNENKKLICLNHYENITL